jgi:omega-amidase
VNSGVFSEPFHLHAAQLDCAWEDPPASLERLRAMLPAARISPGDLLVLPEMFLTGFSADTSRTAQINGSHETEVRALALQLDCAIIAGLVTPGEQDAFHNEAVFIDRDGALLGRYRKRRLFTLGGEHIAHRPGSAPVVIDWNGRRVGLLICYDLRFPELARELAARGAELIVCIASWPIARTDHWITLLRARAIENQAFVAGVNRCGRDPNFTYPGRSVIVDPHGIVIADAGAAGRIASARVDLSEAREWRRQFPALSDAGFSHP